MSARHRSALRVTLAPRREVAGQLTDPAGKPVAGGLVWAEPLDDGRSGKVMALAAAGADGRFTLRWSPAPGLAPRAAAPGYLIAQSLAPGKPPWRIALASAVELAGKAVDGAGRPCPGARVTVRSEGFWTAPRASVTTGLDGSFRVPRVGAGERYRLEVTAAGFAPASTLVQVPAPVTGKPATPVRIVLDAGGAFEIPHLRPGSYHLAAHRAGLATALRSAIDLPPAGSPLDLGRIVVEPGAVLEGTVTDRRGAPVAHAEVSITPSPRGHPISSLFDGPVARLRRPQCEPGAPREYRARRSLPPGRSARRPALRHPGLDRGSSGGPRPGRPGAAHGTAPHRAFGRRPAGPPVGRHRPAARLQRRGPRLRGAPGGSLHLDSRDGAHGYDHDRRPGPVLARRPGGRDGRPGSEGGGYPAARRQGLSIAEGQEAPPQEITLEPGSSLSGVVRDGTGHPVPGAPPSSPNLRSRASPRSWRTPSPSTQPRQVVALVDESGTYRLADLAPGVWNVTALTGTGRHASDQVTLGPGTLDAKLDLDFESGATLSGRVSKTGAPWPAPR